MGSVTAVLKEGVDFAGSFFQEDGGDGDGCGSD